MSTADDLMTGDPLAALRAQFAGQAPDNPAMAMLMQWFEQRQASAAAMPVLPAEDVSELELAPPTGLDEATRADVRQLLAHSAAQEEELATLRARNDTLAAALGACRLCFGDDVWCPECGGRGRPGACRPVPAPFTRYVRPLLNRLRPTPGPPGDGGDSDAGARGFMPSPPPPHASPHAALNPYPQAPDADPRQRDPTR